jgi:hypothetical protein
MQELINDLCAKTGIDQATAQKVAIYLKDNITKVPQLLGAEGGGVKGVVGSVAGKLGDLAARRS